MALGKSRLGPLWAVDWNRDEEDAADSAAFLSTGLCAVSPAVALGVDTLIGLSDTPVERRDALDTGPCRCLPRRWR